MDFPKIWVSLNLGCRELSERHFYLGDSFVARTGDRGIRFVSGGVASSGLVGIFLLKELPDAQPDA